MERRFERGPVPARLRVEPVTLQDSAVERRVGVDVRLEELVVFAKRGGAIALAAVGREDGAVLPVGQRDLRPRRQLDRRVLDVGRGKRGVRVVRRRRKAARQRQQVLALLVEDVLLLPIEVLEREAVEGEIGVVRHPLLDGRQRDAQQLGIEPGGGLARLREQNLDLLTARVDLIVALIFVVLERCVIPDLIRELTDVVRQLHRREQGVGTLRERALERRIPADLDLEILVGPLPLRPTRKNVRQIPLEPVGNVGAIAKMRCRRSFGGRRRIHPTIISGVLPARIPFRVRANGGTPGSSRPWLRYVSNLVGVELRSARSREGN